MTRRRRRTKSRVAARHVVLIVAIALLSVVAAGAFLHYRSTLERPDPFADRTARNAPDRLSVRQIAVRHPAENGGGVVWSTITVPLPFDDVSSLGKLVVSEWARRVMAACGAGAPRAAVAHFFYDERRIAYIDFDPSFYDLCPVGTTGERELVESLEQTVRANIPSTASVALLSGGTPVTAPWRHLATRAGGLLP